MLLPALLACLFSPFWAGSAAQDDGGLAPAGRWTTAGGSASRSARSATPALRPPVADAWEVTFEGKIESEPLVWDDRLLVSVHERDDRRVLHTLDLLTGEPACLPRVVRCEVPLEPSVWAGLIVLRTAPDRVTALRWGKTRISELWTERTDGPVSAPLVWGPEVYVTTAKGLHRLAVGRNKPVWTVAGEFIGAATLRGRFAYALRMDRIGQAFLAEVERESGNARELFLGRLQGGQAGAGAERVQIIALERGIYVRGPRPFSLQGPITEADWMGVPRPLPSGVTGFLPGSAVLRGAPAEWGGGWLAYLRDPTRGDALVTSPDASSHEIQFLSYPEEHPEFTRLESPPSLCGDVAYLGSRAVDLASGRILWNEDRPTRFRAVPAGETVLLVEGDSKLVALRRPATASAQPILSQRAAPGREDPFDGRAVLRDGSLLEGRFELAAGRGLLLEVGLRDERIEHELTQVLLVEAAAGELVWAASEKAYRRAIDLLVEESLAGAWGELADDARRTNDVALLGRMLGEAVTRGSDEKVVQRVQKKLEDLGRRPASVSSKWVERVLENERTLASLPTALLWLRAEAARRGAPRSVRLELLERVLEREPTHADAGLAVRELLPEGVGLEGDFTPLEWIEYLRVSDQLPVHLVRASGEGSPGVEFARKTLTLAGQRWREDLVAFESDHLLILTPLARPGAVARCLSIGELVCAALGEIFSDAGAARASEDKLVLYLYETREEYQQHNATGQADKDLSLEWSAGHYDYDENVSRIFVPDEDLGGFESVVSTYAHELTHHWLRMQCPLFTAEQARVLRADLEGYWIVEGFASMVEEFQFDLEHRTWQAASPRSLRLDTIGNASDAQVLDWKTFFGLSQKAFHGARFSGSSTISSSWHVGRRRQINGRQTYYHQAAATCHFLYHADDGFFRGRLLEYLASFYTADEDGVDVQRRFGTSPEELGRRVREFARAAAGR